MSIFERDAPPNVYTDGVGKIARVVVWRDGKHVQTEMRWGLAPFSPDGSTISLLRAEARTFARRCLIVANDFYLRPGSGPNRTRRRVEMITPDPFFCFAGTWAPEIGAWPAAFAGITVDAYADIAPFQDRHMAVVRKADWRGWLNGEALEAEILRPFPVGSFRVSGPPRRAAPAPERHAADSDLFA